MLIGRAAIKVAVLTVRTTERIITTSEKQSPRNNSKTMNALTLTDLNNAIAKFSGTKKAPEGLLELIAARNYMLGMLDVEPKDPRPVLDRMGWKR